MYLLKVQQDKVSAARKNMRRMEESAAQKNVRRVEESAAQKNV